MNRRSPEARSRRREPRQRAHTLRATPCTRHRTRHTATSPTSPAEVAGLRQPRAIPRAERCFGRAGAARTERFSSSIGRPYDVPDLGGSYDAVGTVYPRVR